MTNDITGAAGDVTAVLINHEVAGCVSLLGVTGRRFLSAFLCF